MKKISIEKLSPDAEQMKDHLSESSLRLTMLTAHMVYEKPSLADSLIEVAIKEKAPWANRASAVLIKCTEKNAGLITPYFKKIVKNLPHLKSAGSCRNFLKILSETDYDFTEKEKSILLGCCFDYLEGESEVGVKIFSIDILYRLSKEFPEIRKELVDLLENQMTEASPGFISRASKAIRNIQRDFLHSARSR